MHQRTALFTLVALLICSPAVCPENGDNPPQLTIESIVRGADYIGAWPRGVRWAEDGSCIYFSWNPDNAEQDALYVVPRNGGEPRQVTDEECRGLPPASGSYDRNRTRKVFERDGDIFLLEVSSGKVQQLTCTAARESYPAFTADGRKITFTCENNLFLIDLTAGGVTQLTDFQIGGLKDSPRPQPSEQEQWLSTQEQQLFESLRERNESQARQRQSRPDRFGDQPPRITIDSGFVSWLSLSPNERWITFRVTNDPDSVRPTIIPDYVTESAFTTTSEARPKVGGPRAHYRFGIYDTERDTVYFASKSSLPDICRQPEYLSEYGNTDSSGAGHDRLCPRPTIIHGPFWSDDGRRAVVEVRSLDHKDRWIALLGIETGELEALDHQHDEAWIGGPGIYGYYAPGSVGWYPDNRRFWFQSEASGYSHLYAVDVTTGAKTQLTNGTFEVSDADLSRDGRNFYFISNEVHPGERHFYRLNSDGGRPERITSIPGSVRVFMSPDEEKLALLHSTCHTPWELFVQNNKPKARPIEITHSLSEEFRAYPWREPEIVTFTARDSATVYARLYHAKESQPGGPAVLFVHGAGYMQNVCRSWTWYYREQMFHNFLADRGYLVMDIDYRGSAGYGRDWRTGIYRHMGGKDLSDHVDGVRFLVDKYGIDPKRVGLYGGSYGGFIALMAIFTEPETFTAAAALRAVTDWAHYEHGYTSEILNLPYTDSLAYVRSSPIYFAEGLQGALLICHGMIDDNVHFQDVVRLSQRLIELGKENWELAAYPAEPHTFRSTASWTDEYKRIFKLFEENLK